MTTVAQPKGWLLYDGDCGFCSRWVPRWRKVLGRRGFEIAPLQEPWVAGRLALPDDVLLHDVRLLLANGDERHGADVYRYVMRRIWWTLPLYVLTVLPGLSWLVDGAYRLFADNRHWISRTCHMPVQRESAPDR